MEIELRVIIFLMKLIGKIFLYKKDEDYIYIVFIKPYILIKYIYWRYFLYIDKSTK